MSAMVIMIEVRRSRTVDRMLCSLQARLLSGQVFRTLESTLLGAVMSLTMPCRYA